MRSRRPVESCSGGRGSKGDHCQARQTDDGDKGGRLNTEADMWISYIRKLFLNILFLFLYLRRHKTRT